MKVKPILPAYAKVFVPDGMRTASDISFINIAYRPKPTGAATGGPNGVLAIQQQLFGDVYRGFYLRYSYEPKNFEMPEVWAAWIKEQKLGTMSKNLLASHYFIQNYLSNSLPTGFSIRPGSIYHFICHDIGSAAAAHMCGFPFTLVYHQQGSFIHERTSFGEELNETERYIMNTFEQIAFEEADRVYFPSEGAKNAFLTTTTAVSPDRVKFGHKPLYNTVTDFEISESALRNFLSQHGLGALLASQVRKNYLIFVSVGDYTSNKGIDRCPDILTKIAISSDRKVIWICMGSKHKSGIYEKLYLEKSKYPFEAIFIPTRQDHALTMALIKFADWLLMLQRHSIFDFSTLEAMKLGTGVVLSPIGGNLEFNKEANILYIDPERLSEVSIEALVDASPDEFGLLNKQVFERYFSPAAFIKAYRSVYDDVIARTLSLIDLPAFNAGTREKAKAVFEGKTVLVCGPGSSLNDLTSEEMQGKVLVALNSSLLADQIPFDIHVMQDEPADNVYWGTYLGKNVLRYYGVINRPAGQHLGINFGFLCDNNVTFEKYNLSSFIFDDRVDVINFNLDENPVRDMRGVLFSAIQIAVWAGAIAIEFVGIDFSTQNFGSKNVNVYNRVTLQNFALIVKKVTERGVEMRVLHSTSDSVKEIVESGGMRGLPDLVAVAPTKKPATRGRSRLGLIFPNLPLIQSLNWDSVKIRLEAPIVRWVASDQKYRKYLRNRLRFFADAKSPIIRFYGRLFVGRIGRK